MASRCREQCGGQRWVAALDPHRAVGAMKMPIRPQQQKGSAAVEFAIVLPLLMMVVLGIMDFGTAFFNEASAAGAAREGVRVYAISSSSSATTLASGLMSTAGVPSPIASVSPSPSCSASATAAMKVTWSQRSLTGFFPMLNVTRTYTAVMRCGG